MTEQEVPRCQHGVTDNGSCHRCFELKTEQMRQTNLRTVEVAWVAIETGTRAEYRLAAVLLKSFGVTNDEIEHRHMLAWRGP
jgi:hypothetical protein